MKRIFSIVLICAFAICSAAYAEFSIEKLEAPSTDQQQRFYDHALTQVEQLIQNMGGSRMLDYGFEEGMIHEAVFDFMQQTPEELLNPKTVVLFLPTENCGKSEYMKEFGQNCTLIHGGLGMSLSYKINSSMGEFYEAMYLDEMSVYDSVDGLDFTPIAFVCCMYEAGEPNILTSYIVNDSDVISKTTLLYHKQFEEIASMPGFALMIWGDDSFEITAIAKPDEVHG